jgi:hypothetical protein
MAKINPKERCCDLAQVLSNSYPMKLEARYHISKRGVPYVSVGDKTACYFGSTKTWNIYDNDIVLYKGVSRDFVIKYFKGDMV